MGLGMVMVIVVMMAGRRPQVCYLAGVAIAIQIKIIIPDF